MSTSVSSVPTSDLGLSSRVSAMQATSAHAASVAAARRPILVSSISGPMPAGADPMSLFDSLLVSVDITGPRFLRSSRYASQIYSEMQRLLMHMT
ncbi:hypothetical protein [Pseudooceanicola sp. LIPI14-2-Ac024]|uniref:hypothetical protein n=1 Tax=Pseudooceanicola sp. LIPI14-2-Ac024 TaxID=3344875 RepID=UPI0035CEED5E